MLPNAHRLWTCGVFHDSRYVFSRIALAWTSDAKSYTWHTWTQKIQNRGVRPGKFTWTPLKLRFGWPMIFLFKQRGKSSGSFAVHFRWCTLQLARSFQHVVFEFPKSGYLQRGFPLNPPFASFQASQSWVYFDGRWLHQKGHVWGISTCIIFCVYRKKKHKID